MAVVILNEIHVQTGAAERLAAPGFEKESPVVAKDAGLDDQ